MQHKIFFVHEFIKTESATAVQRAFRLRFKIQPSPRKSICCWSHQFEQIGCLCKGKSSSRPCVSEENVRRIQESFEHSPCKSTCRASRELGIPQPTVWRVLRRHLLFKPYRLQLVQALHPNEKWPSFWITLYIAPWKCTGLVLWRTSRGLNSQNGLPLRKLQGAYKLSEDFVTP